MNLFTSKKEIIEKVIGAIIIIAVVIILFGSTSEERLGAFADTFLSILLADDPDNGECLTTDGTDNVWSSSCGGGGSSLHVDGGGFVYPQTGDYHSAPYYVGTSSTASTFAGGAILQASSTNLGFLTVASTSATATIRLYADAASTTSRTLDISNELDGLYIKTIDADTDATSSIALATYVTAPSNGVINGGITLFGYGAGPVNSPLTQHYLAEGAPTCIGFNTCKSVLASTTLDSEDFTEPRIANGLVAVGSAALDANTTGAENTAIGASALGKLTTGSFNTGLGHFAGSGFIGDSSYNTIVGQDTMTASGGSLTGSGNTTLGAQALRESTTADNNVAIGLQAGENVDYANKNIVIGANAWLGSTSTLSANNVFIGAESAQYASSTGSIAIGFQAGLGDTGGGNNSSDENVFIGSQSGLNITTASDNTFIGDGSGLLTTTGNGNISLGYQTADNITTGSENIVIGYNVNAQSATADETLNIGNLIFGSSIDGEQTAISSGGVGIGSTTPFARLSVAGQGGGTSDLFMVAQNADSAADALFTIGLTGQLSASSTATSTFAQGIDISAGCFAIGGTCISGSGISNIIEDTSPQLGGDLDTNSFMIDFDDAHGVRDDSSNEQLIFQKTASAVNYVEITNAATGGTVAVNATGDDTHVDLSLSGKGNGDVYIGLDTIQPALGNLISNLESGNNLFVIASHSGIPGVNTYHSRGTDTSPSASLSGDSLYFMGARGYGATGYGSGSKGVVNIKASQNWTDAAQGTQISFEVTPNDSTTRGQQMLLQDDGVLLMMGGYVSQASSTVTANLTISSSGDLICESACIDISDETNLAAGRSLTLTGDSVAADAELYTDIFSIHVASSTLSTTTAAVQHKLPTAVTISRVSCSTDTGTSTIQLDERSESTPNTGGTDILTSQLDCGSGHTSAATSFSNAGIAADAIINLDIDKTDDQAAGATPTQVRIHVDYTYDD